MAKIKERGEMKSQGLLTDEEFAAGKARTLGTQQALHRASHLPPGRPCGGHVAWTGRAEVAHWRYAKMTYARGRARRSTREHTGGGIVSELGDLAGKAEELAQEHPDQVKQGLEKAGQVADEKTGGQHTDQIDKAEQAAEQHLTGGPEQG